MGAGQKGNILPLLYIISEVNGIAVDKIKVKATKNVL
jgi:hypothetical protein